MILSACTLVERNATRCIGVIDSVFMSARNRLRERKMAIETSFREAEEDDNG